MDPLVVIVYSEQAYRQLIADAVNYGRWHPYRFNHNPDQNGMGLSDNFEPLKYSDALENLGVYTADYGPELTDDYDDMDYCDETLDGPLDPDKIKLDNEKFEQPQAADYPILITWQWPQRYDDVKIYNFMWRSIAGITISGEKESEIGRLSRVWHESFAAKHEELIRLYEQRDRAAKAPYNPIT